MKSKMKIIAYFKLYFFLFFINNSYSQDIYNYENSLKYAEFLYKTKQYSNAAEEYERLIFLKSDSTTYKIKLVNCFILNQNYQKGIDRINLLYPNNQFPEKVSAKYSDLLILNSDINKLSDFLSNPNKLNYEKQKESGLSLFLLKSDWMKSADFINSQSGAVSKTFSDLSVLNEKALKIKYKNKYLAGGLSAILPGAGKFYTENYVDGFISLMFLAANTWQSARGFQKNGIKSAYGWIFGTVSFGFYISNIYGSAKSARKYNEAKNKAVHLELKNIILSEFD